MNDLFVFPDLKVIKESLEEFPSNISGEKLLEYDSRILILGDEQSGKTALAKKIFLDALSSGLLPLLIEGANIRNSKIEEQTQKLVSATYHFISAEEFFQRSNLVCIVDDISASTLNKKAKSKLIASLNSIFPRTILLAEDSFRFVVPDFSELDDYKKL